MRINIVNNTLQLTPENDAEYFQLEHVYSVGKITIDSIYKSENSEHSYFTLLFELKENEQ